MDKTILPLSPADMVDFFKDKTRVYLIDYKASLENLTNPKFLLMYIANLGLKCNIDIITPELMFSYMQLKEFTDVVNLQRAHANILYLAKFGDQLYEVDDLDMSIDDCISFAADNHKILINQMAFLNSIPLFILTRLGANEDEHFGHYKESLVTMETNAQFDEIGYSVIQLFTIENFLMSYLHANIPLEDQIYFTRYFDEYMFNGNNIFAYVFNSKNAYAGLFQLAASVDIGDEEAKSTFDDLIKQMHHLLPDEQSEI